MEGPVSTLEKLLTAFVKRVTLEKAAKRGTHVCPILAKMMDSVRSQERVLIAPVPLAGKVKDVKSPTDVILILARTEAPVQS